MLLLNAIVFAGFGLALFVAPEQLNAAGLVLDGATGRIEARAFYGGIELGIGAFLLHCARKGLIATGLRAAAYILGGIALARGAAIALDGGTIPFLWAMFALEASGSLLSLWALRRQTSA